MLETISGDMLEPIGGAMFETMSGDMLEPHRWSYA